MKIRTAGALLAFAVAFPLSFTETHPGAALVALCICIGLGFWVIAKPDYGRRGNTRGRDVK